ncbi:deleted in malignant brain tumors 1 protein-like [Mya arenaria]|uniref:deleted in malignant brain tumors 1 protein-like n=1 Tax=Mya arenaria TaxID=6604 RepID=UPI0022DFA559|nr:deleted in malignant brain tumors 1 protein-like [Mya arenaria]
MDTSDPLQVQFHSYSIEFKTRNALSTNRGYYFLFDEGAVLGIHCGERSREVTDPYFWRIHSYFTTFAPYYTTDWYTNTLRPQTTVHVTASGNGIRLVNGHSPYSGRVEVIHNGQWGTVCDDSFDGAEVEVICRMLGLQYGQGYGGRPYSGAYYGQGSGPIWLDDLMCGGKENNIANCRSGGWGIENCAHSEDAGVDCHAFYITYPPTTVTPSNNATSTFNWWQTTMGLRPQDVITVSCDERGWELEVDMNRLRLIYPGARASDIYLGENTCTGVESWGRLTFQQGLRECLTSETIRGDALVYKNELVYADRDPQYPFIIRAYNWTVGVECDVSRNGTSLAHIHHDSQNTSGVTVDGASHYGVNMSFYRDPNFLIPIYGNPLQVPVGTDVYVKVFVSSSDWSTKMRVHSCYTKPSRNSPNNLTYYLIKDGCVEDVNTRLISQSTHETRFVFQDFEYTANHEGIDVMCDATFCSASDVSSKCRQSCHP